MAGRDQDVLETHLLEAAALALGLLAAAMTCEIASPPLASPPAAERCYRIRLFQAPDQYWIFLLCQKHVQEMGSLFLSLKKRQDPPSPFPRKHNRRYRAQISPQ